jgi:hypothetical protein
MGLSSRIFLIDNDGVIYRMSNERFARMLRHPEDEPLSDFASQRIRCADLVIELIDRVPTSVCRETFAVFEFDHQGRLDRGRFEKQQVALVDAMLEPILSVDKNTTNVVDATQRFIAQGGAWTPSKALRVQIERVALGIIGCLKL